MMNYRIMPMTKNGRISLFLLVLVIFLAILANLLPIGMKTVGLPSFQETPLYAFLIYSRIIASVATAFFALIAIYKEQEKGLLIITALLQGFVYLISFISVAVVYAMN